MRYVDVPIASHSSAATSAGPSVAGSATPFAPVSVIGLGTWQFGSKEWGYGEGYDDREAVAIVRRALELGVTLFDTAEVYGFGRSERILGAALKAAGADPEAIVVASKIFPVAPLAPVVQQRALASAARLGVRRIDLYQVHQPNPLVKDGTTMRGMRALQEVGLVGHVGVSNYGLARWQAAEQALQEAARTSPNRPTGATGPTKVDGLDGVDGGGAVPIVLSNQVQYSLVHRAPEVELIPYARDRGRLVIAYSPLAQGLLSGKYDAAHRPAGRVRAMSALFLEENLVRAAPLIETLREVAAGRGVTPSQAALAWVLRHGCVAAIPGAASVAQLESNVAAAQIVLTPQEVAALDSAAAAFVPVTGRAAVVPLLRARRR